jgi:uncharacterized protein (TIGR00645 family)
MDIKGIAKFLEETGEQVIFASRWLLAPIYLGLSISIAVLLVIFLKELWHLATHALTITETDAILGVLALVDLAMTGSLIIIVVFSGYENFVSKIDHSGHMDWPEWMGTIDFTALKLKLLGSIVAISAIQLLKEFMKMTTVTEADERKLYWLVVIHMVFVGSSVLLALSDWISGWGHGEAHGADKGGSNGGGGASHGSDAGQAAAAAGGKGKGGAHASAVGAAAGVGAVSLSATAAGGDVRPVRVRLPLASVVRDKRLH